MTPKEEIILFLESIHYPPKERRAVALELHRAALYIKEGEGQPRSKDRLTMEALKTGGLQTIFVPGDGIDRAFMNLWWPGLPYQLLHRHQQTDDLVDTYTWAEQPENCKAVAAALEEIALWLKEPA